MPFDPKSAKKAMKISFELFQTENQRLYTEKLLIGISIIFSNLKSYICIR